MTTRRDFLRTTGLGTGCVGLGLGSQFNLSPDAVRFTPEIEPLVRWLEDTPRERLVDGLLGKIRDGLSYRDGIAATFLAAIRNIKPRPVGFKFHAVMAIHSAHLIAQQADRADAWLPLFWAADNFKSSQARDVEEGDWTLSAVDEARVPGPVSARAELIDALDRWDADKADAATAGLVRAAGASEVMEVFWRYGLRDQRNIGHKPIFTMQCWRTLQAIGWQHAEPVLRSLAFGLLDTQGDGIDGPVGPYAANLERARSLGDGWRSGRLDEDATRHLVATIRTDGPDDVADAVVAALGSGVAPASLWDAVLLAASELLVRAPGIIALHAVTATNALHYTFQASGDDETRRLALLQAASWVPLYRRRIGEAGDFRLDQSDRAGDASVEQAFDAMTADRTRATSVAIAALDDETARTAYFAEARRRIIRRGRDSHQYKYGAAAWEEAERAASRPAGSAIAAAMLAYIPRADEPENPVIAEARAGLAV